MNKLNDKEIINLIDSAVKARENAYAPYSKFKVGAAVLAESGKVFSGCNVENASFGATVCAERVAIFKAVSEGAKNIRAIAIVYDENEFATPCGICRQVISEFGLEIQIIMANLKSEYEIKLINELLPDSFGGTK